MPLETARLRIASEFGRLEEIPGLRKADWNAEKIGSGGGVDGMFRSSRRECFHGVGTLLTF